MSDQRSDAPYPPKVQAVLDAARRSQAIPSGEIETCRPCVDLAAAHPDRWSAIRLRLVHEMHHREQAEAPTG